LKLERRFSIEIPLFAPGLTGHRMQNS